MGRSAYGDISGSSPLARGLPRPPSGRRGHVRIIPARAGFTVVYINTKPNRADHPRSRGVYMPPSERASDFAGSSPLARGLRVEGGVEDGGGGIIPARAGFTSRPRCRGRRSPDHPRSRGVYRRRRARRAIVRGSSPLARGLRICVSSFTGSLRIIPARAGFTLADPWNPNEPTLYQTPAAVTADLGPAPPGRDSAVEFGAALSAAGRAGRDLAAAGLRPRFGHHPDMHRRVATTSG